MGHHQKYFRPGYPEPNESSNDPLRLFIRRHRKKILLFLGVGIVAGLTIVVFVGIFLFKTAVPVGTEVINQTVGGSEGQDTIAKIINWVTTFISNLNPTQWLTLLLQLN